MNLNNLALCCQGKVKDKRNLEDFYQKPTLSHNQLILTSSTAFFKIQINPLILQINRKLYSDKSNPLDF